MPLPSYSDIAERLKDLAAERSEWAGIAMPIEDHTLITEPRYPYRFPNKPDETPADERHEVINRWFSKRLRGYVLVARDVKTGKSFAGLQPWNGTDMLLGTVSASIVWPIEAEEKAMEKLAGLLPEHQYRYYLLAGAIIETSKRSGIIYIFRKLRPTIAIKAWKGTMAVLGTLCLHPIGYYAETWAGVMVPTDDVIAHLLLMRGDEHHYWKQANQHAAWHPQSGI